MSKSKESFKPQKKTFLTDEDKLYILAHYEKVGLIELTRTVFKDESLDGRCAEGRMIKEFLASRGAKHKTTEYQRKTDTIVLSDEQKEFIVAKVQANMKPMEIAQLIFADPTIIQTRAEALAVQNFIENLDPHLLQTSELYTSDTYKPPRTQKETIKRIAQATGKILDDKKLSKRDEMLIIRTQYYLSSERLKKVMDIYKSVDERRMFEQEFVKTTWEKPDLSADELNLYINLVIEYIKQLRTHKLREKLETFVNSLGDDEESLKKMLALSKQIADCNKEYTDSAQFQQKLVQQLEGIRSQRVEQKFKNGKNIVAMVEAFQDEDQRKRLVQMAEERKKVINEEIERLENFEEATARIFGISKDEILE